MTDNFLPFARLQDTATNEEERNTAIEVLKSAKEAQKDDPIAGQDMS